MGRHDEPVHKTRCYTSPTLQVDLYSDRHNCSNGLHTCCHLTKVKIDLIRRVDARMMVAFENMYIYYISEHVVKTALGE